MSLVHMKDYTYMVINDEKVPYEYNVAYKPITVLCILFMFIEMKIYSLSFHCDVCNEVHEQY